MSRVGVSVERTDSMERNDLNYGKKAMAKETSIGTIVTKNFSKVGVLHPSTRIAVKARSNYSKENERLPESNTYATNPLR